VTLLATILRFLVLLLVARLLFRFVASAVMGYRGAAPATGPRDLDLVRDRVCNTYLPRERALEAVVDGRTEHFCSAACRDRAGAMLTGG
jgi:hypothetical protein